MEHQGPETCGSSSAINQSDRHSKTSVAGETQSPRTPRKTGFTKNVIRNTKETQALEQTAIDQQPVILILPD